MTRELCRGLPPEYWDSDHDGARLALAVCRRCPAQPTCLDGDPKPRGVVRAGVAFADDGTVYPPCPTCGYPQIGRTSYTPDRCVQCALPPVSRWRSDIQRWRDEGVKPSQAARWIGVTAHDIGVALRPAASALGSPAAEERPPSGGTVDEDAVKLALEGQRMNLSDDELEAAAHAGKARGLQTSEIGELLGMNTVAVRRLLNNGVPPRRARHAAMVAALKTNPHRSNREIADLVGVDKETVRRARRQLEQQSPIAS